MKATRVTINKINPPELPDVVLREGVFRLLDQKKHHKVTWISSLAGSGKTTLVASYLKNREFPCLWYEIDKGDVDIATFFYYLGISAGKIGLVEQELLPVLTPEYLPGVMIFARRFFENFCSLLVAPFYFVFDNYHEIPPESPFHEVFKSCLSGISPEIHVLVMSRVAPPQVFASMLANGEMRTIGSSDLLLSLEESRELLKLQTGKKLPDKIVSNLHEITKGWAAGLVLMAKSTQNQNATPVISDNFIPETIFQYFASELFDKTEEKQKEFLLKTAFLPKMTSSMANTLTDRNDAERILSHLRRNHLFTDMFPGPTRVYQYHPLFREFLKRKATEILDDEQIHNLKRHAGQLLREFGEFEEAIDIFFESKDFRSLVELILEHARELIQHGRHKTLAQWISKIPEDILIEDPWLLFWLGVSFLHTSALEARKYLKDALDLFKNQGDVTGLFLSWSSIVESIIFEWNDFKKLDQWLDWFEKHVSTKEAQLPPEIEAKVAITRAAALVVRRPNKGEISALLEKATALSREIPDTNLYMDAISWAITHSAWTGDFTKIEAIQKETQKLTSSKMATPAMLLHWKWLDISTRTCTMEGIDSALDEVSDALEIVKETGLYIWEHLFLMPAIFISFVVGDLTSASKFMERFQSILDISHYHIFSVYHYFRALYNVHTGNLVQAKADAEIAVKIAEETAYILPTLLCRFQLAYVLSELGEITRSREELSHVYKSAVQMKSRILEFMSLALSAKIAFDQGHEKEGIRHLRKAFTLGKNQGFFTMAWWWHAPTVGRLCSKALAEGIEVEYVRKMIRLNRLTPDPACRYDAHNWPWPLQIRTLDRFQIIKNDEPIRFSRKAQKMPVKLLKVLIAYGGIEVHADKIIDALWYDSDGDMGHNAFSTTLNRLRNLLGIKNVLHLKDGKLTLDRDYCAVDTWVFNDVLDEADTLWKQGAKKGAITLYEKALEIYRSHFLADEPEEHWMIPLREHLKNKFISTITRIGKYFEKEGEFEDAIKYYERGLSADNLEELFYQRIMLCNKALGRKAEALKAYKRCEHVFRAILNIDPSLETKRIYKEISG